MKKMQKLITVLAVVFSAALFLTSCEWVKDYIGGGDVSFTVTFMADGEIYDETTVKEGEEVVFPKDPEKEGYTFVGWTYDGDTVFEDFEAGLNIVMYAKWVENI
ncbi:MAG: InlB B-repeat-containing protein, partial [Clostridiales bacterium]|nr:InlB B-repeat-containing protein [Clostridiales bacterium]